MPIVENSNSIDIGFKAIVVLFLIGLSVCSFLAFVNNYPALGYFFAGIVGFVVCAWILLSGHNNAFIIALIIICAVVAGVAYWRGVPSEWHKWRQSTEQQSQLQQGNYPIIDLIAYS